MVKINLKLFNLITISIVSILSSFFCTYSLQFLSKTQVEYLISESMIALILVLMSIIMLIQAIVRVNKSSRDMLEIIVEHKKSVLAVTAILALTSIIIFYFAYKMNNRALASVGIFLMTLVINGFITHKSLSGISDTYVFYAGRRIPIEAIEYYEIGSVYVYVRVAKTYLFMDTFEMIKLSIKYNDLERFKAIMDRYNKPIVGLNNRNLV